MSVEILNHYTGAVLYTSATAQTIAEAVLEAASSWANLSEADLSRANLSGQPLGGGPLGGEPVRREAANLDPQGFTRSYRRHRRRRLDRLPVASSRVVAGKRRETRPGEQLHTSTDCRVRRALAARRARPRDAAGGAAMKPSAKIRAKVDVAKPPLDTLSRYVELRRELAAVDSMMHGFPEAPDRHGRLRVIIEALIRAQGAAMRYLEAEE